MTSSASTADGVGMFVAAAGERLAAVVSPHVHVGTVRSCAPAVPGVAGPRMTVQVNDRVETLMSMTQALSNAVAAGSVVGRLVMVVPDAGQWIGVDLLTICEGTH